RQGGARDQDARRAAGGPRDRRHPGRGDRDRDHARRVQGPQGSPGNPLMSQVVRIGMLGSGFVADFYMDGLRDVPGTEVVANYSRSEERAREFGRRYDVPRQYTTVEDLCADREVELVVIGLPNHLHLPAVRAAAAARKAIVCTKPLARNGHEAAEMVSL